MVSQEKANQDVADEVSEAVDSRDEVMHSERNGTGNPVRKSCILSI